MDSIQRLYQSKLSMTQGLLDSKRAAALAPVRTFSAALSSAVKNGEPQFFAYRTAEQTKRPEPSEKTDTLMSIQNLEPQELMPGDSSQYDGLIRQASEKYGVSFSLIKSVMKSESNFRSDAVSRSGAMGLMQLMPNTARGLGVTDAFDPAQNIDGGTRYLKKMLDRFGGDVGVALAAYNCGPNRVAGMSISNSADTEQFSRLAGNVQRYVSRVMERAGLTLGSKDYANV